MSTKTLIAGLLASAFLTIPAPCCSPHGSGLAWLLPAPPGSASPDGMRELVGLDERSRSFAVVASPLNVLEVRPGSTVDENERLLIRERSQDDGSFSLLLATLDPESAVQGPFRVMLRPCANQRAVYQLVGDSLRPCTLVTTDDSGSTSFDCETLGQYYITFADRTDPQSVPAMPHDMTLELRYAYLPRGLLNLLLPMLFLALALCGSCAAHALQTRENQ